MSVRSESISGWGARAGHLVRLDAELVNGLLQSFFVAGGCDGPKALATAAEVIDLPVLLVGG